MSWNKRGPGAAPVNSPPYAAPQQGYGQQQQPKYEGTNQQQFWQPQFQQQPQQQQFTNYPQQHYGDANNHQQQYNHNYALNQAFATQQMYQQNYYPDQAGHLQQSNQNNANSDNWEDNWDWGWDEASKQNQPTRIMSQGGPTTQQIGAAQPVPASQNVFNNANVIEESFASTNTWNWNVGSDTQNKNEMVGSSSILSRDTNPSELSSSVPPSFVSDASPIDQDTAISQGPLVNNAPTITEAPTGNQTTANTSTSQVPLSIQSSRASTTGRPADSTDSTVGSNRGTPIQAAEVRSLADETVKEHIPHLALGKRFHPDNLTPQWSIESQMSQESSDGPLTHSEETYRSENQSRNSSKSSPGPNTEFTNYNYFQSGRDEHLENDSQWPVQPIEQAVVESVYSTSHTKQDELCNSVQGLSLNNTDRSDNHQVSNAVESNNHMKPELDVQSHPPTNSNYSSHAPAQVAPPAHAQLPPPPPPTSSYQSPGGQNPFKQSAPFTLKNTKSKNAMNANANLTSPAAVNRAAQHSRTQGGGFGANLETTPENSERPDQPQTFRPEPVLQELPENLEIAPQNDRNQYLQTAHLSTADYGENADFGQGPPPLGLRRMVVGQQEGECEPRLNLSGDEPPPGLARMVPGQHGEGRRGDGQPPSPERRRRRDAPTPDGCDNPAPRRVGPGLERAEPADQRELLMDGENLQDLDAAPDPAPAGNAHDRNDELSDSMDIQQAGSRRHSLTRINTSEEDSERDRSRREKRRSSRDKDRDIDAGHYPRAERNRKYEREERRRGDRDERSERGERRERGERSSRGERGERGERREWREHSDERRGHSGERRTWRPARGSRPHRYDTEDTEDYCSDRERERRRGREGSAAWARPPRDERPRRDYRAIDPARTHARRREEYSPTEPERRRSSRRAVALDGGYLSRAQYDYYSRLRLTDPHAYMQIYRQLVQPAAHQPYGPGYEARDDRASLHSGRSSANLLKGTDALCGAPPATQAPPAPHSILTDYSDRELTTDMSLSLQLDASTARSDRMTPLKFATSHLKGRMWSGGVVVCGGAAAGARLVPLGSLLAPPAAFRGYPGPLRPGLTHKKSVLEYCERRAATARDCAPHDLLGYSLVWDYLALLLRQNGVVVGSDIAELLMKNVQEYEYTTNASTHDGSRRSSSSVEAAAAHTGEQATPAETRLREYLLYGNRHDALEWSMKCGLWGHALVLAALEPGAGAGAAGARGRVAEAAARFAASLAPRDPARTLYSTRLARRQQRPLAWDESGGDWRPHAAILLANADQPADLRHLIAIGDWLNVRGLTYSAQVCYVWGGERPRAHPLAPWSAPAAAPAAPAAPAPRLALLLADPRAPTLRHFATDDAIIATELYEYAMSLTNEFVIDELLVYKLLVALRLVDAGDTERALQYARGGAAAAARPHAPHAPHAPHLRAAFTALADRLAPPEDAAPEPAEADSGAPSLSSPAHWLRDMRTLTEQANSATSSHHESPQHVAPPAPAAPSPPPPAHMLQPTYEWGQPQPQYIQPQYTEPQYTEPQYTEPQYTEREEHEAAADFSAIYADPHRDHDHDQTDHADYWRHEPYPYGESSAAPQITMPGSAPARPRDYDHYLQGEPHTQNNKEKDSKSESKKEESKSEGNKSANKSGWLGGILTKLSLRPPNQMILPDDKNPTIVWDEASKQWRNVDGTEESPGPPPPPPRLQPQSTSSPLNSPAGMAPPPAAAGGNIYKLQKGRQIKKAYVDVLGGVPSSGAPPAAPAPRPAPHYFVPSAAPPHQIIEVVAASPPRSPRSSSASSASSLRLTGGMLEGSQVDSDLYNSAI